jgi:hypothetical protein
MENVEQAAPKKEKFKLSEEAARDQMQSLLDSYDIEANDLEIENGPEWVATVINRLVRAIRAGHVEILDNGQVRHNLVHPKADVTTITYRRLNGIAMKERDKAKGGAFEKDCAFMGSLCGSTASGMAKMDPIDISIMQRLGQLFMVV